MIALRKNNLALVYGDIEILEEGESYLAISRKYFDNEVIAIFNIGDKPFDMEVPPNGRTNFYGSLNGEILTLPPNSFEMITYN